MRIPNFVFRRTRPRKPLLPNSVYLIEDKSGNKEVISVDRRGRKTYICSNTDIQANQQHRSFISSFNELLERCSKILVFNTLTERDSYSQHIQNDSKILAIVKDIEGDADIYHTSSAIYYRGPETDNTWAFVRAISNGDEMFVAS